MKINIKKWNLSNKQKEMEIYEVCGKEFKITVLKEVSELQE